MKNYITMIMAFCAVILSSCQNDDIPVTQSITFKVNSSTVVSSLYEYTAGDLSSIYSDEKLYVSLYIYNAAGNLVGKEVQTFSDYTHIMNTIQNIGAGEYTVVASTHIIDDSGFKYWDFTGQENLSTFTVTDEGYIGGSSKILGLSAQKIQVTEATKEISVDIECAGAVALVQILNWNRYSNVSTYGLLANKSCDDVKFDYNGQLNYSIETQSDYAYWMTKWSYESRYTGAYGYTFMFPCPNINMSFVAVTTTNSYQYLGTPCSDNIQKGHSYWFAYDVTEDKAYWADATTRTMVTPDTAAAQGMLNTDNLLKFNPETKSITIER